MPIQFVGSASISSTSGLTQSTATLNLTALTGGIGSSPIAGDFVLMVRASTSSTTTLTTTNYTTIYAGGPYHSFYRRLVTGAENTISLVTPANQTVATIAMVFRGVDATTPFDAPRADTYKTGTSLIDPGPVTSVTNNALAVVLAFCKGNVGGTSPTGYSTEVTRTLGTAASSIYACFKNIPLPALEDPGTFGNISSGSIANVFFSTTVLLRADPAAAVAGGRIKAWNGTAMAAKPVKVWNGTAWVEKPLKYWDGAAWQTTKY